MLCLSILVNTVNADSCRRVGVGLLVILNFLCPTDVALILRTRNLFETWIQTLPIQGTFVTVTFNLLSAWIRAGS